MLQHHSELTSNSTFQPELDQLTPISPESFSAALLITHPHPHLMEVYTVSSSTPRFGAVLDTAVLRLSFLSPHALINVDGL